MGNIPRVHQAKRIVDREQFCPPPDNAVIFYVMKSYSSDNMIKLGIADNKENLLKRLKEHEKRGPTETQKMEILCLLWASRADETSAIDFWKKYATKKNNARNPTRNGRVEWFKWNDEMKQWIQWLMKQPYTTRFLDSIDRMPYMANSKIWLPPLKNPLISEGFPWSCLHLEGGANLETDEVGDGDYYTNEFFTRNFEKIIDGGRIMLDPASCSLANNDPKRGVHAKEYIGSHEDGLKHQWKARTVWLNPPFGDWPKWGPKALREFMSGEWIREMGVLLPINACTTKAVAKLLDMADCVLIPSRRYGFWGPKASSEPPEGHVVFYFGHNISRCIDVMKGYGTVKINSKFYEGK